MSQQRKLAEINQALTESGIIKDSAGAVSISKTAVTLPALTVTGSTTLTGNLLPTVATVTATSPSVTATGKCGVITTESLSSVQNALYTLTVTLTGLVTAGVPILVTIANGTNSAGTPMLVTASRTDANTLVIVIANKHASAVALNGTLLVSYWILG